MTTIAQMLDGRPGLGRRFFFLARRFVAGETVESAIAVVRRLNAEGLRATLDFLGEHVLSEKEAVKNTDTYVEMLDRIATTGVDSNVSVKLSAIGQAISEDCAMTNLQRIIEKARPTSTFVRLDMEGSPTVDSTYRILDRARAVYEHVGPVVQACLHRAPTDVKRLIAAGIRVRLCKGAYKEPADVAIQKMPLIRRRYAELAEQLLTSGRYPAIATHDQYLIDAVKAFGERERIGPERFEFQMLHGIRPQSQRSLVREGYRMRVYVPFGIHWAGYFYRRLAERKENVLFVVRSLFSK